MALAWLWLLLFALSPAAIPPARVTRAPQSKSTQQLALGKLLVAGRSLADPHFVQTVVLIVHYEPAGVIGLVINRRGQTSIAQALSDIKAAQHRTDFTFEGGPVEPDVVFGLLRSTAPPEDEDPVLGDVALVNQPQALGRELGQATPNNLRIYVGYAGWDYQQLQNEVRLGAWYVFPGDAAAVFDPKPETLWTRYIRLTEGRIALR